MSTFPYQIIGSVENPIEDCGQDACFDALYAGSGDFYLPKGCSYKEFDPEMHRHEEDAYYPAYWGGEMEVVCVTPSQLATIDLASQGIEDQDTNFFDEGIWETAQLGSNIGSSNSGIGTMTTSNPNSGSSSSGGGGGFGGGGSSGGSQQQDQDQQIIVVIQEPDAVIDPITPAEVPLPASIVFILLAIAAMIKVFK